MGAWGKGSHRDVERHCGLAGFLPPRPYLPMIGPAHSGLGLIYQIAIKKMPTDMPTASLLEPVP